MKVETSVVVEDKDLIELLKREAINFSREKLIANGF
jgi:hypothetical protein